MRIFILEDDRERLVWFFRELNDIQGHQVRHCDNVDDAKMILTKLGPFDVLFLDHDLDNRQMVNSEEKNTGYQLAKWIRDQGMKFDQIIVHSMNPAGAKNIQDALADAAPDVRWVPFCELVHRIA